MAEEVKTWQNRSLDVVYPIVYLDALQVKIREAGQVQNRAIYVAIGINLEGNKEVLGLWAGQTEKAKFWLQVVTELKNRGVQDIYIGLPRIAHPNGTTRVSTHGGSIARVVVPNRRNR